MIKKLIKFFFKLLGYKVTKIQQMPPVNESPVSIFTTQEALRRFLARNKTIDTVIDVGASDGRWSEACMEFYPNAQYHLIEAQDGHLNGLKRFDSKYANGSFVLAAAGSKKGTIYFDNTNLFGGVASTSKIDGGIEVPVVTIDDEINERNLKGPFLIKLDTHGFEIPILEGAKKSLKHANLVVIETYNFQIEPDSLKYWEMCSYMDALGFRPIENVDFMLRERDQAFWQMDTFFIPKEDKIFESNTYL